MVELSALPERAVWIGFFHGQFLVPTSWLSADESEMVPSDFPDVWQSLPRTAVFCIDPRQAVNTVGAQNQGGGATQATSSATAGQIVEIPVYIVQLQESLSVPRDKPPLPTGYYAGGLRTFIGNVNQAVFAWLSRAAQLLRWHRDFQYCPGCGAAFPEWVCSGAAGQETVKQCLTCETGQYPRISPCVLVLVTDDEPAGQGKVLLARGVRHPPGFWSTLAGFIEPGETAEAAVAREVAEEVGVSVGQVVYRGSQSWPFPHALMLGFWAKAEKVTLKLDPAEIVDAKWFSVESLREDGLPEGMFLPPVGTLSRQLIDDYLDMTR